MLEPDAASVGRELEVHRPVTLFFGLGIVGISLLIAAIAYFSAQGERKNLHERASLSTHNVVNLLDVAISGALARVTAALDSVALEWREHAEPLDQTLISAQLVRQQSLSPEISSLRIVDTQGLVRFGNDLPDGVQINLSDRQFFQQARNNPQAGVVFDGPLLTRVGQQWVMVLGRRLEQKNGDFAGVVYANISLEHFQRMLNQARLGEHGAATIRTASLALVARNPMAPLSEVGGSKVSSQLLAAVQRHPEGGEFAAVTAVDGIERINVYRRLRDYPLYVLAGLAIKDLAPEWHTIISPTIGLALLAIILVVWGGVLIYRATSRLAEQEARFRRFFEQNGSVMLLIEADTGQIMAANQAATAFYGYPAGRLLGMQIEAINSDWQGTTMLGAESLQVCHTKHQLASGEWRDVDVYSSLIVVQKHRSRFSIIHDVTAHKQTLVKLHEAKEAAEAASRAKSAFVANMSHEIRTPMNAVLGLLALMHYTPLNERQSDYIGKAQTAAQSLLAILDDILDFSKVEVGKLVLNEEPFQLDELMRNLSVVLSSSLQDKPIELVFDIDPQLPAYLCGDAMRLQQVLLNLAGNALKFTEQGEVRVSVQQSGLTDQAVRIRFAVQDSGVGIPEDRLSAIFEGFTQAENSTTRRYGGSGLGLAISQRLVALMGGELQVESRLGEGSCFQFSLELGLHQPDQEAAVSAPQDEALHVLIVDDSRSTREMVARMLKSAGWSSQEAASSQEAMLCLQAANPPIDLVLMGGMMPTEALANPQQLGRLASNQGLPVILMVTHYGRELLAKQVGSTYIADGFLVKPITSVMLFEAIAKAREAGKASAAEPSTCRVSAKPLAGLHLLLVEDNPLNQQVAQELLCQAGATLQMANNGREGIAAVHAAPSAFDAVLMDIQMPEMDGYQATRQLRAEGVSLPIIAMTANALGSDRDACLAAGMDDHLGKPIDMDALVRSLLQHCGREVLDDPALERLSILGTDASLPAMPTGFELADALARLGEDRSLFARLVRQFARDQASIWQQAMQAMALGDRAGVGRELHTLKGLAATLGAGGFAAEAAALEARIGKAGEDIQTFSSLLAALKQPLDSALHALLMAADYLDPPQMSSAGPSMEPQQRQALLVELSGLLAERNMRALTLYTVLKSDPSLSTEADFRRLDEAMDSLDFATAHQSVVALLERQQP